MDHAIVQHMMEALQYIKTVRAEGITKEGQRKINIDEQMVISMGALCKLFVGDLVRDGELS